MKTRTRKEYYPNGRIKLSEEGYGDTDNFVRHGKSIYWSEKRALSLKEECCHGKLHGERIEYHDNETPEIIEHYEDGKLNDKRSEYDINGQLTLEEEYKDDELNGKRREWDSDVNITKVEEYKHGKKHGTCTSYAGGEKFLVEEYFEGVKEGFTTLWLNNEKICGVFFQGGEEIEERIEIYNQKRYDLIIKLLTKIK